MLPTHDWKSDTTRNLAVEMNDLLLFLTGTRGIQPSVVALESGLRVIDADELSNEVERDGYQRVIEELHDRLDEAREQARIWAEVAEVFCQAHDIDFDPRDPDAMLIAAGECRDQS